MEEKSETKQVNIYDKVNDLEKRVVALEKIEHRRKIKNIVIFCIYSVVVIAMIVSVIYLYGKLKPYKEKIDNINGIFDTNSNYSLDDYTNMLNDLLK